MVVMYGKFKNSDSSMSLLKSDGRTTAVLNKPIKKKEPTTDEVFDYTSDEVGSFFMRICAANKYAK